MIRQELVLDQGIDQEAHGKEEVHHCEFYNGNFIVGSGTGQNRDHDTILQCGIERNQRMVGSNTSRQDTCCLQRICSITTERHWPS